MALGWCLSYRDAPGRNLRRRFGTLSSAQNPVDFVQVLNHSSKGINRLMVGLWLNFF